MKKLFFLTALLCASVAMFADYTTAPGANIGGGGENDKFQWYEIDGITPPTDVVNIQKPAWSEEIGIYTHKSGYNKVTFNGIVKTNGTHYHQDGAGVILFLSALTAKNTEVLFYNGDNVAWGLRIHNDNGSEGGPTEDPNLTLSVTEKTLNADASDTCHIRATYLGEGALSCNSSNNAIATVAKEDGKFVVTAVGRGTATITISISENGEYAESSKTATITVNSVNINWDALPWVANSNSKFKVDPAEGQSVVNVQHPGFADEDGIYTTFPDVITACSLGDDKYAIQGTGVVLFLSAFTKKYTDVTVTAGNDYEFTVYNVEGSDSMTAITYTEVEAKAIKVIENGQLFIIKNGVKYNALGTEVR